MQEFWSQILDFFGNDDFNVRVYGTFLVSMVVYWGVGGLFTYVDVTGKPKFALKYKVQENVKSYPISKAQLYDLVTVVLKNQFLNFFLSILAFYSDMYRGLKYQVELPSFITSLGHFAFFLTIREITFYYSHRIFHMPFFYKRIHKKHHTWISPVAISASYCHPIEQIVSNVLPIVIGPSLLNSHTLLLWAFIIYSTIETLTVHSGFHFPLLKSPEFHDFHHLKFNYNYGVMGILDYIHGTDSLFRNSKQFLRNKRTFSLTPIKEILP